MEKKETGILLDNLKKKLKSQTSKELAFKLLVPPTEISRWRRDGITIAILANMLVRLATVITIDGNLVKEEILKKLKKKNKKDLVSELGLSPSYIYQHLTNRLSAKQLANLIFKSRKTYSTNSIKPIIEFYKIKKYHNKKKWEVFFPKMKREKQIKERLEKKIGIYIFYDSQGKALYIGKSNINLWNEIKDAFNRRRLKQTIFIVKHPQKDIKINWNSEANRQIKLYNFNLHEIAEYFSAYEIGEEIIPAVEAALIRLLPNDLYNKKIEKISKKVSQSTSKQKK